MWVENSVVLKNTYSVEIRDSCGGNIYINPVENPGRMRREYIKLIDKYWSFGKPDTQFGKPDTVT